MENQQIEAILNKVYAQPDLKDDVFNFINPIILKAYGYLKQSESNAAIGVEQKTALNNIIFKDIAKLIDIYTSLPITYRNEKPIKNGKTHRQMLIGNLELIAHKMSKIENDIYEHFDREMAVKGRVLEDKYADYVAFEKEDMLEKMEDSFQWNQVKSQIEQQYQPQSFQPQMNSDKVFVKDNSKVTFNNGQIGYSVKNKTAYYGKKIFNFIGSIFKWIFTPLIFVKNNVWVLIPVGIITAFMCLFVAFICFVIADANDRNALKGMYKVAEIAKATKNSKETISQVVLDNYSKQYNVEVIQNEKQITIRSKLELDKCIYFIKNLSRKDVDKTFINKNEYTPELEKTLFKDTKVQTNSDLEDIRKSMCNAPNQNIVEFVINK